MQEISVLTSAVCGRQTASYEVVAESERSQPVGTGLTLQFTKSHWLSSTRLESGRWLTQKRTSPIQITEQSMIYQQLLSCTNSPLKTERTDSEQITD